MSAKGSAAALPDRQFRGTTAVSNGPARLRPYHIETTGVVNWWQAV